MSSWIVPRYLEEVSENITKKCMYAYQVRMRLRVSMRLCMVKKMLYIEKAPKGKIPNTWHFWSVKIPKLPYITSVQITGLLPWLSEKLLVTVVLDHPVQILRVLPVLYRYHTDYQFRNTSNCTMYRSQSWDGYRKIWSWEKNMVAV